MAINSSTATEGVTAADDSMVKGLGLAATAMENLVAAMEGPTAVYTGARELDGRIKLDGDGGLNGGNEEQRWRA